MGRKNTKGTQKINPIIDASIESPPYETALGMSNTEEVKRDKQDKDVGLKSCYCKIYKNIRPTKTWESITKLYGDADTTEVWDSQQQRPKTILKPKLSKKEKHEAIIDNSEIDNVILYPKSNLKNAPVVSLIGLYRKHKHNRNEIKKNKPKQPKPNYATGDVFTEKPGRNALEKFNYFHDLEYTPYKQDNVTHKRTKFGNNEISDSISPISLKNLNLQDLQCKCSSIGKIIGNTIKNNNNNNESTLQTLSNGNNYSKKERNKIKNSTKEKIKNKSKNKQAMEMKMEEQDRNVEYDDNILPIPLKKKDLQDLQRKCSFIGKMLRNTICKCKNNNESTLQTLSNPYNNNKKENNKMKNSTKDNKIMNKSKNKQAKAKKTEEEEGNVGYGDQISPIPLKKKDLQDLQYKCSFFEKIIGNTICKCNNHNGSPLKTSSNVNTDKSKKENNNTKTPSKVNKIMTKSKNKKTKAKNMEEEDLNVGYGDQISPIPFKKPNLHDLQCKCSFFGKMVGQTICKCKNDNGNTFRKSLNQISHSKDPTHPIDSLLEMKVNLKDMCVINSSEIDKKIRKLGRKEKKMTCICPSKQLDDDRVCESGPCKKAFENQQTFYCKCQKQTQNLIECKDSTCDLKFRDFKVRSRKKKNIQSPVYRNDKKPLFEVMLDPNKMKIINSNELKHIIKNSSQSEVICPTGICNTMSKQRNTQLNCKCVGKKLLPLVNECEERTCRNPERKSKISCLCSRIFSKSENWTGQSENRMRRPIRGNGYGTYMKRNGVMINLPRGRTPKKEPYVGGTLSDVWCKCFCECDTNKPKKRLVKKKTIKKIKKKTRRRRKGFFRRKKKDHRTLKEKFLDCLDKEQEECEKRIKKKSKEYKKNENKAIKENKRIELEQKDKYLTKQYDLNCLTSVIIGILNVSLESIRTAFKVPFSVVRDPVSSYVYVKEKIKNPPAAIIRIIEWFIRTWRNKTSIVAKSLEESATLNIIADQIESSSIYNALTSHGRTPVEEMVFEKRLRKRKRRMQKRQDEAVYGCRHVLLMTMRKTPCIWFYHICPELYPQCLGVTQFMHNFLHIILFCGAVMCWTPCIVACEMCRAFLCCFLCTN